MVQDPSNLWPENRETRNYYQPTDIFYLLLGYKRDKEKAMIMSKEYNRTVKYMQGLMTKAERIHAYMQMCRKYETQDEKILPIMDSYPMRLPTIDNDILPLQMVRPFISNPTFRRSTTTTTTTISIPIRRDITTSFLTFLRL